MNRNAWIVIGVAIILLGGLFLYARKEPTSYNESTNATSTIPVSGEVTATNTPATIKSYGQVKLALKRVGNISWVDSLK